MSPWQSQASQRIVLTVENLSHQTGKRWLLHNCSFTLPRGFTALLGPNGAGKSTLLRTVCGLLPADGGQVYLFDEALRPGISFQIGYIPQFPGIYPHLTSRQFLHRTALWSKMQDGPELRTRIDAVMEKLHLSSVADAHGHTLHSGQRRRLALASLWIREVAVVLLDEPTAGLDAQERLNFWQELYELSRSPDSPLSYLITTHLLSEAEAYCSHLVFLQDGQVRLSGSIAELSRLAQDKSYWVGSLTSVSMGIDTGRVSDGWHAVLSSEAPQSTWKPRQADLLDGYLWLVRGGDDSARN